MLTGQLPPEEEQYLRTHAIPTLFSDLQTALLTSKPEDPYAFLKQTLDKMGQLERQRSETVIQHMKEVYTPTERCPASMKERRLSIVVFGASGDLSKKKTLPALHSLYYNGLLPNDVIITGYNRSKIDKTSFQSQIHFKKFSHECTVKFMETLDFVSGGYDSSEDFARLAARLREREGVDGANRLFYLALPPTQFIPVTQKIHEKLFTTGGGWNRVVVEKPFGKDLDSSNAMSAALSKLLREEQIYRIDHYLGKEMVQNIVALRFANKLFSSVWNRNSIHNVQITFKEPFGTEGRGGYFDEFGIIRDVIQNHLLQIVALIGMDNPKTLDPERIRDEKVALLKCIEPVRVEDTVVGQYVKSADGKKPGYLDDATVPAGSRTPTFATCVLRINNDAWQGVPFIVKAGKALDGKYVVIRIQFREQIQPYGSLVAHRNELVIRCQPDEAMYVKIMAKTPGMENNLLQTELDLTYNTRFQNVTLPDAYESLIYDVACGCATNFVRTDELEAAWRIFTPLLHKIDKGEVVPIPYEYGSRGPPQADELVKQHGFIRNEAYNWTQSPLGGDNKQQKAANKL